MLGTWFMSSLHLQNSNFRAKYHLNMGHMPHLDGALAPNSRIEPAILLLPGDLCEKPVDPELVMDRVAKSRVSSELEYYRVSRNIVGSNNLCPFFRCFFAVLRINDFSSRIRSSIKQAQWVLKTRVNSST